MTPETIGLFICDKHPYRVHMVFWAFDRGFAVYVCPECHARLKLFVQVEEASAIVETARKAEQQPLFIDEIAS